jgi:hypothetical protein
VNIQVDDEPPPGARDHARMGLLPCRIVLQGELSDRYDLAFGGLSLRHELGYTELSGTVADRAQLWSLLDRLFGLGMEVVTVQAGDGVGPPSPGNDV